MRRIKHALLEEVLAYQYEPLIHYFCAHHKEVNGEQAKVLFKDLLAWLWLHAYRQAKGCKTYFFGPLLILDTLWHAFILHTRVYHTFCMDYFGEYIHHDVEPVGFEHTISPEELADFLSDALDILGKHWVARYFPV